MTEPTLYILMRSDMDSLNAGKAMAQAAHAANAFTNDIDGRDTGLLDSVDSWQGQTDQGFGTTIVLDIESESAMEDAVLQAQEEGFPAATVLDPTYPIRDGKVTHVLPVYTCAYVFTPCRVTQSVNALSEMTLHP